MTGSYEVVGSYQTVRVLSQTSVLDVQAVAIYTLPSNTYVVVQVPLGAFVAGNADGYLQVTTDLVESVQEATPDPGQRLVAGIAYVQDVDASGLIAAFLDCTVAYVPTSGRRGPLTTIVRLPMTSFETAAAFDAPVNGAPPLVQLTDAYGRLKALAGAT